MFIKLKYENIMNHLETSIVSPNARLFSMRASKYIFEDNEAVKKQISKGRSPTLRHVSRTHRVDLDLFYDRIILYPIISNQVHRHNTAAGRHPNKRILHRRQMNTTDTVGQQHDSPDIYSKQFDSFFCGCQSFIFLHEQT